jgi:predicted dehydrogenase
MSSPTARRDFLKAASAAVAATAVSTATAIAKGESDKLRVALIGCGGRGRSVASKFADTKNVKVVGVCDVDEERRGQIAQVLGLSSDGIYTEMRRVLDDKSIDAVIVATPDHWHSLASILACDAGKHVYVEKPISHNIREGRLLVDASARNKTIVQHGTQCRSTDMMIDAVKLLREGVIGTVLAAKCWNVQRRNPLDPGKDTDPPATLNYDDWVGAATMIPYRTNRVHKRWTMWHHFGTGDMGNDGVHDIDYTRWGLGVETHPTRIVAIGGKYVLDDDGQFPDTQQVTFEYPGDGTFGSQRMLVYEQRLWSSNYPHNCDSGAEFYGSNGEMLLSRRGKIQVFDKTRKAIAVDIKPEAQNDVAHIANFCDAIRGDGKVTCDALTGHMSTSLCHLGNIATRVGRSLQFDPKTEHIVGDAEADALVHREYREHWGTPKGV